MVKKHFIPEGEVIYIPTGRYRFVGPTEVLLDPSFNWPLIYESGKLINYDDNTEGKVNATNSKQPDNEMGAKSANSSSKKRRKPRKRVGTDSSGEDSSVGQSSNKSGKKS